MSRSSRQRISEAIAVRWTPSLAARVRRRISEALVRRRRRQRVAVVACALLLAAGASFAFPGAREEWQRHVHRGVASPATPAAPADVPSASSQRLSSQPPSPQPPAGDAPQPAAAPPSETAVASHLAKPVRRPRGRVVAIVAPRPSETVASLLAAADAARLAGRPADAIAPLTAVFTRYPTDPRAAVAAFQLGRVLADELGDPQAAARAFERARELAPAGPLAADAATRAAEARRATHANQAQVRP